jgi:hypothetical protein
MAAVQNTQERAALHSGPAVTVLGANICRTPRMIARHTARTSRIISTSTTSAKIS